MHAATVCARLISAALAGLAAVLEGDLPGLSWYLGDRGALAFAQLPAHRVDQLMAGPPRQRIQALDEPVAGAGPIAGHHQPPPEGVLRLAASLAAGIPVSEVRARQASRGVRSGIASSVIRKHWDAAEIYPQARYPMLRPTPEQMQMLRMFQPDPDAGWSDRIARSVSARLKALDQGAAA